MVSFTVPVITLFIIYFETGDEYTSIRFDERFRHEDFVNVLSDTVTIFSDLAKYTGSGQIYQNFSNLFSVWNNTLFEPIRDTYWRTPSHKSCEIEKYSLFRYDSAKVDESRSSAGDIQTPLLIVYAFINRHYILDLLPEVSVVRSLLKQGFDIFATEWDLLNTRYLLLVSNYSNITKKGENQLVQATIVRDSDGV